MGHAHCYSRIPCSRHFPSQLPAPRPLQLIAQRQRALNFNGSAACIARAAVGDVPCLSAIVRASVYNLRMSRISGCGILRIVVANFSRVMSWKASVTLAGGGLGRRRALRTHRQTFPLDEELGYFVGGDGVLLLQRQQQRAHLTQE